MEKKINKQKLVDKVINEMKLDIAVGDWTAIDELLKFCPIENLKGYLPEPNIKQIGDTIQTVGDLKEFLNTLNDNDQVCLETIDLETGDVQDLYPFYIDVIDRVQLTDGSIINEVRFCQQNNKIWLSKEE